MRDTKDSHARHRPGYTKAALSRRKRHEKHKPQHPLSLDFEDSLDNATIGIAKTLSSSLAETHQICLSRLAAVASKSQALLSAASEELDKIESASALSDGFKAKMAALEDFAIEKRARLGELCKVVQDVNQEIIELQREAKEGFDVDGGLSDATKKIAAVGAKYGKQMEKCEKELEEEGNKQRLAAAMMDS